jgi:hypothetical protein
MLIFKDQSDARNDLLTTLIKDDWGYSGQTSIPPLANSVLGKNNLPTILT